jgi:dTDP-4-dehydrorhamnose reductase
MKKMLILGAKGMLGQELVRVFSCDEQYMVTAWDREEIDVTNFDELEAKTKELGPDIILNAVAYNAVDLCETDDAEYAKARILNVEVPRKLAQISQEIRATIVHYSTDYVFDGSQKSGYDEEAQPQSLSRYGETKLGGERGVLGEGGRVYVIRLSKLFGKPASSAAGKRSFFDVMLEKGRSTDEVRVVDDERSCFTYAPDLAEATKAPIEDQVPYGIYHLPNEGGVTWYEAVQELYRLAHIETKVTPVTSEAFPRPAKRPATSILLNTKRPKLREYREALEEYLKLET